MHVRALGYVGLGVSDVGAWERYATSLCGLQIGYRENGIVGLRMDDYHHRIRLHEGGGDDILYAGWEVASAEELAAVAARVEAGGVKVTHGSQAQAAERAVAQLVAFEDPDGLKTEVFFGPLQRVTEPFHSGRALSGFVTGEQGLGHIVVNTRSIERTERFYSEMLGFRVSDYVSAEMMPGMKLDFTFMRCNPRHHSLALFSAPMPKRLQHLMLQVNSLDDVGRAYDMAQAGGAPITLSLGRHVNDRAFSFYMSTPSGFDFEYGCDTIAVDDAAWHIVTHHWPSAWGHRLMTPMPVPPAAA